MFDGNRRLQVMRIFVGLLLLLGSAGVVYAAEGPAAPTGLRCEYLSNPMGIDVQKPRFSWVLHHSERAQIETAYQILIGGSAEGLAREAGDVLGLRKSRLERLDPGGLCGKKPLQREDLLLEGQILGHGGQRKPIQRRRSI